MNTEAGGSISTQIPARLDRLPWTSWHWLVITALGVTWILDGLEVTLAGALGATLKDPAALGLSDAAVGASSTTYLAGAVVGALFSGYLADRFGRKRLFYATLAVYLAGAALSGFAWNFWSYAIFRAVTGAGIGGEYAAINSAIDELIPARVRGQVDLGINATYWLGAALGSVLTLYLLDARRFPLWLGWRLAFGLGALLGLTILFFRQWIPESPRWLMVHGQPKEADRIVAGIESNAITKGGILAEMEGPPTRIHVRTHTPWGIRALAISLFFAVGTLVGGVAAPSIFGYIIGTGSRELLFWGYITGAGLMVGAAVVEALMGVKAERRSLESIAAPLSSRDA